MARLTNKLLGIIAIQAENIISNREIIMNLEYNLNKFLIELNQNTDINAKFNQ